MACEWHMKQRRNKGDEGRLEAALRPCMIAMDTPMPEPGVPAMTRTPRERTRQRCVMITDSEWEMITSLAGRAGMSNSRFLVERALESREPAPEVGAPSGFPPEVRRRMALGLLVLARVEERRVADAGAKAFWDGLVAEESVWLDAELSLENA